MRELSNAACIVGVDESDEIGTLPGKSQLTLHVEAIANAVRDAGLRVSDIDGVFTAGQHSPVTIAEAVLAARTSWTNSARYPNSSSPRAAETIRSTSS